MDASIIAVGSELLGSTRLDTNSLHLTALLEEYGAALVRKAVVGDDRAAIVTELETAARCAGLILITGGLGPTQDDLTRDAVASWSGRTLRRDPELVRRLEQRYAAYGRQMPASNLRQAEVVEGAEVLDNPAGTAPGVRLEHGGATVLLFPGVPRELEAMAELHLRPLLEALRDPESAVHAVEARLACTPESAVEDLLAEVYREHGRENVTVLARPGEVRVVVRLVGPSGASRIASTEQLLRSLGAAVFTLGKHDLAEVLHEKLLQRGETLAVAESCTGGLLGARLTAVPGSSATFVGGAIVYSNALKELLLGVSHQTLADCGAVSAQVAGEMARGARERLGSTYALAITGVAGPSGGSAEKPVGTVDFALAAPDACVTLRARFPGGREAVRMQASQFAMDLLRRRIDGLPTATFWTVDQGGVATSQSTSQKRSSGAPA